MLKRLVKQRNGRILKTRRTLSENGRLETFAKNRRFLAKMGGLESLLKCRKITVFLLINCDRWYAITTSSHVPCFAEFL